MATQKKTAEVDYSMQEKIMALYELQKIDSKIDAINKVKGELPLEVQDLEDEMVGLNTRIEHINAEVEERLLEAIARVVVAHLADESHLCAESRHCSNCVVGRATE